MNSNISQNYLIIPASKDYAANKIYFFCFGMSTGFTCIKVAAGKGIIEVTELTEIESLGILKEKPKQELIELLNKALVPATIID